MNAYMYGDETVTEEGKGKTPTRGGSTRKPDYTRKPYRDLEGEMEDY